MKLHQETDTKACLVMHGIHRTQPGLYLITALVDQMFSQNEVSSYSAAQSRCVTPAASAKDAGSSWVKKKTNIANQSEVDYKKLALVNDDLLKVKLISVCQKFKIG